MIIGIPTRECEASDLDECLRRSKTIGVVKDAAGRQTPHQYWTANLDNEIKPNRFVSCERCSHTLVATYIANTILRIAVDK